MRTQVDCWGFSIAKDRQGRGNEDYFDFEPQSSDYVPKWTDFAAVVADGVGSSEGPAVAAATTAQSWLVHAKAKFIENKDKCARFDDTHFNQITAHAFAQAHEAVVSKTKGSACAAAVCIQGGRLMVGNVGDCRVYRVRGIRIEQVSKDQVDTGGDPTHVVGGKRLPEPYAAAGLDVKVGDVILLCSDGVWKLLGPADIQQAAAGTSAREISARLEQAVAARRGPGSDDATAVTAVVRRVGNPFWEIDNSGSGDDQLKDDLVETKLNEVLAELLNRVRAPLDKQAALTERQLNQLGTAVDELRGEIEALRSEMGGARRGRKQTLGSASQFISVGIGLLLVLGGFILGSIGSGNTPGVKPLRSNLQLPENAKVVSQKYENDRLLVRFIGGDSKPKLAIFRLEDGGRPFAIVDLPAEKKPDGTVP